MGANTDALTDGSGDNHTAADLETIVVDADDIVAAFERNRRDETEQRTHVLRVTPPLKGEQTATLFSSDDHAHYPVEMDPKPLHLGPEQFVGSDEPRVSDEFSAPSYSEEQSLFFDENNYYDEETGERLEWTDEMDDEFDEWWDVATEVWESHVRAGLRDEITLRERTANGWIETTVDVRYEDNE